MLEFELETASVEDRSSELLPKESVPDEQERQLNPGSHFAPQDRIEGISYVREIEAVDDGNGLTETVKSRLVAPYPSPVNQYVTVPVWLEATGP